MKITKIMVVETNLEDKCYLSAFNIDVAFLPVKVE